MVGEATWEGWSGGEVIVDKALDFYLLIRSAGGHVPERRLRVRIDEALGAASRVGVELPALWRTPAGLIEELKAKTEELGQEAKAKLRDDLEISRVHFWRILSGERKPSFAVLCRWASLIGHALHLRRPGSRSEATDDGAATGGNSPGDERRACEPRPEQVTEPVPHPADEAAPELAIAAPDVAQPVQDGSCESDRAAMAVENVAKPVRVSAFTPTNVAKPAQIDALTPGAVSIDSQGVAQPDRQSASPSIPPREPSTPISARPGARIRSREKIDEPPSTIPNSPLSSSTMPLEFRRKSKVVGTIDPGVTDPDELKRIAFEALRSGVAPADSTPYINGQAVDMTVYLLERRIAEETKRREEAIAALEQRLMVATAEKVGEVMKEIEGLKSFTRETLAAVGADIHRLREEFRATVERLVETPTLLREGLRDLLRAAGGQQKDDKKEKDHGN